ncbi:MAG: SRPBCC family protein, partial [Armatimonadetes bacterium]|nr:SRPBCC family protein [Armatimonadota bacterium]
TAEVAINAPLEKVYAIAKDIERFPEFMEDVEKVEIVSKTPDRQVSMWVAVVREFGRRITWTEEDFWSDEEHLCRFRQIDGDFTSYEGVWSFVQSDGGTLVRLEVTYEYRVPLVGPLIQNLLRKKVQHNCEAMLAALKARAEAETD